MDILNEPSQRAAATEVEVKTPLVGFLGHYRGKKDPFCIQNLKESGVILLKHLYEKTMMSRRG